MIIYHSREALTARLAALIHAGRISDRAEPNVVWKEAEVEDAYRTVGLWQAGLDLRGRPVCAVGRSSRPDVAERAFCGLARVFGISPDRFLLVDVGPDEAWGDLLLLGLRQFGLIDLAHSLEIRLLRRRWRECQAAVAFAQEKAEALRP